MKRNNLLFMAVGLLAGFVLGYISHETMAARQPQRLIAGQTPPPTATPQPPAASAGQPAMAQVQQLRAYVDANPDDAAAVRQLADLNFDISNWQRAIQLYEQYLTLDPGHSEVLTDLGVCYRSTGEPQEALARFRAASASKPDHWQARYNEAIVLGFDLGDLDGAATVAEALVAALPDNAEVKRLYDEIERRRAG